MYSPHLTLHLYHTSFDRVTRHTVSPEGYAWWLILLIPKVPVLGGARACPAQLELWAGPGASSPAWHVPAQCHGTTSRWQDSLCPPLYKAPLCASCAYLHYLSICLPNRKSRNLSYYWHTGICQRIMQNACCFLNNDIHNNNLLAAISQPDHFLQKNAFDIKLLKIDLNFYLCPFPLPHF